MDSIRDLQKRLKAAQQTSNAKKISERNCIALVQKLIGSGQIKLYHTSNGKEWLTPDHLDHEIREALASSGGRLDVTELPGKVGVAIEHCEPRVEHLCKKDSSLQRLQNDLLNNQYLKYVAQEIEESLQEEGCIAVSDIATRYTLPASFIKDRVLLLVDVDSLVIRQNSIHTQTHATRVETRVRGALRACTQPVSIIHLAGRHGLEADMVAAAVQQLVSSGDVLGKLQAGTFTPRSYVDAQSSRVDSFFSANQYLPLSLLRSVGIDVRDWARTKHIEGVSLSTAFLAAQLLESATSSIIEALTTDVWTDVQTLLPPSLTSEDAAELLQHLAVKKQLPANAVILHRIIMSNNFVKGIASNFDAEVKSVAQRLMATQTENRSGKRSTGGGGNIVDDSGTSKKKGKRGARSKKGRGEEDNDADDGDKEVVTRGGGSGGNTRETLLEDNVISDKLLEEFPEIPEEIHEELIGQLQPLLAAMVSEEQRVLQAEIEAKQQAQFEVIAKLVQERHEPLVVGLRALEAAGLQDSPLFQYLLREVLAEPVHQLLALRLQEITGLFMEVTAANRKQCLDKLQAAGGLTEELSRLAGILSKGKDAKEAKEPKDAREGKAAAKNKKGDKELRDRDGRGEAESYEGSADIAELYQISARDCHIVCKKVEKKKDKAAIQELRSSLQEQLKEIPSSDALQVCRVGLQLASAQGGVSGLLFPSEIWALRLVAQSLSDDVLRTQALSLCQSLDAPSDSETMDGHISKWRERLLSSQ